MFARRLSTDYAAAKWKKNSARCLAFAVGYRAPERRTPDWYAAAMLDHALHGGRAGRVYRRLVLEQQIAVDTGGGIQYPVGDLFDYNGPTLLVSRVLHKPEYNSEQALAAYDAVIDAVRQHGIERDELEQVKVKFRSEYVSSLEGGHGGSIPRYGLMHYLACFTLFDNDPSLVNSILDGFLQVTPEQVRVDRRALSRSPAARHRLPPAVEERSGMMAIAATADPFATTFRRLAPERPVVWPARTYRKLANGLEVVLVESHTIPKFTGELYFRSGNANVATKAPGLAEITATVVRTGTEARSSRQIEEDLRRMGADIGTSAGADTSAIAFNGLTEFSSELLKLVAELAQQASFPEEEFERERRQTIEGLRIERTTPSFLASERFRRILFGAHPYAIIAPTEAQVNAYRLRATAGVLSHALSAGQCPVHRGGRFLRAADDGADRPDFRLLETGGSSRRSQPRRCPNCAAGSVHLVHLPEAVQAQVLVGNHAITRKHPDWLRLALANSIYGGAFNSRLVMNIREQKGYTYSPRSGVHALRQHGYFSRACGGAQRSGGRDAHGDVL